MNPDIAEDAAPAWDLIPSGETLIIVEIRTGDRSAANLIARAFAEKIAGASLPFVYDIVPAMTTVGVHYTPQHVPLGGPDVLPHRVVTDQLGKLLADALPGKRAVPRVIEIPVCYGGEHGPDLDAVASLCGLSTSDVVRLHTASLADVMLIGFAPGLPYIGTLDGQLAVPRRATPRTAVAPGSIGLANRQSVIYPATLPGGWNLIGKTPLQMFDPSRADPCLLRPGDQVRFMSITSSQFDALNEHPGGL